MDERLHDLGVDPVLFGLDTGVQALFGISGLYRYRDLGDDRPVVDLLVHEVHGNTGDCHAVCEGISQRMRTGEGRKERRVDIEDPVGEPIDERRGQDAHEPGEDHTLGPAGLDPVGNRHRERVPVGVVSPGHNGGWNTVLGGTAQGAGVGLVREDQSEVGSETVVVDQCLEVAAGSRGEYCDVDDWPPDCCAPAV